MALELKYKGRTEEVFKALDAESLFKCDKALESILKDARMTENGMGQASYKNRYPDYHNCCTAWGA